MPFSTRVHDSLSLSHNVYVPFTRAAGQETNGTDAATAKLVKREAADHARDVRDATKRLRAEEPQYRFSLDALLKGPARWTGDQEFVTLRASVEVSITT